MGTVYLFQDLVRGPDSSYIDSYDLLTDGVNFIDSW